MLKFIPKTRLIELMRDWGNKKITTKEMSLWCCNNYFPIEQVLDPSVPCWQQLAIRDVLEAFEWRAHDDRLTAGRPHWMRAVEFLDCSQESFEDKKQAFMRECARYD